MRFGAVVEGLGERKSVSTLVAKTAQLFGSHAYVGSIVECGSWGAIKKANGLEKFGRLLLAEDDCDCLLYLVDLDDGCPKEEYEGIVARRDEFSNSVGKPVHIVLMDREYETWFLQDLNGIKLRSPEVEWVETGPEVIDAFTFRDAKGAFERHLLFTYRPSIDQAKFTKKLDLGELLASSRSLRKLACAITGWSHDDLMSTLG